VYVALIALAAAAPAAVGCGSRISLGEMDQAGSSDGGGPSDGGQTQDAASSRDGGAFDAGPVDGGPAPDGSTDQDGGAAYDPCAGKACGASCTICPPWDTGCVETAVLKQCDKAGKCAPGTAGCS
jgi:hypothetical protein